MNRRAKFDAAGFILGGEIHNSTNKQTNKQTNKITNSKQSIHALLSARVYNKLDEASTFIAHIDTG